MKKRSGNYSILVGDIGGTRARLSLYDHRAKNLLAEAVLPSREHATFDEIAMRFLSTADHPHPAVAVLGVAGPIRDRVATITNLPWRIEEKLLEKRLEIPRVVLVNDLAAAARGCLHLPQDAVIPLGDQRPATRGYHVAVIAAGTGLGQALLIWDGTKHLVVPTEGGHTDFAPRNPLEIELWHFLASRHPDHVSYERVLSGDGLGALYDFFASRAGREPRQITRRLLQDDRNAVIAELGLARTYRPAAKAVDMFASIYGAEAGNMVLKQMGVGGVFVAGNIARHIVPARQEIFLEAFRKKGRFSAMMAEVPVAVVSDPLVGVRGALAMARDLLVEMDMAPSSSRPATALRPPAAPKAATKKPPARKATKKRPRKARKG